MRIDILTIFPEMFDCLKVSLLGKAAEKGALTINIFNIRDYSKDKHSKTDDYTFGGGAGMLMMPQPIHDAFLAADPAHAAKRIYMSPKGKKLDQNLVKDLAREKHLALLCGHYEGVDQRVIDLDVDMEVSLGDFVMMGGEIPAMALVDAVSRYVPDVLGSGLSTREESFENGLLEYPQYTRPQVFEGMEVPAVLISGDHKKIAEWRREQSQKLTRKLRPDLTEKK